MRKSNLSNARFDIGVEMFEPQQKPCSSSNQKNNIFNQPSKRQHTYFAGFLLQFRQRTEKFSDQIVAAIAVPVVHHKLYKTCSATFNKQTCKNHQRVTISKKSTGRNDLFYDFFNKTTKHKKECCQAVNKPNKPNINRFHFNLKYK